MSAAAQQPGEAAQESLTCITAAEKHLSLRTSNISAKRCSQIHVCPALGRGRRIVAFHSTFCS